LSGGLLAEWLDELEEDAWDRQMEQDFSPGGRGAKLIAEAEADIAAGRTRPHEEMPAEIDQRNLHYWSRFGR